MSENMTGLVSLYIPHWEHKQEILCLCDSNVDLGHGIMFRRH